MSECAITKKVAYLGRKLGAQSLSAHDGHHSWATTAITKGTDAFSLRDAGGWTSMATVSRYVEAAKIANEV
jgi:integrase